MALLDFLKNRGVQQQPTAPQTQPETAKQIYSREATQDKATAKSPQQMPADQRAKAAEIGARVQSLSTSPEQAAPSVTAVPSDPTANPQPMKQASMQQDNAAPALSPTTAQAGAREAENKTPAPSQSKSQEQAKTMARRPPSWER